MQKESFTGKSVGEFQIVGKPIGEGRFSRVYEAYSNTQGKKYAVRVLQPREDNKHLEVFDRGRDMLTIFRSSPDIVNLRASGVEEIAGEEYPYLVMDFAEHGSVSDYIGSHGQLPVSEVMTNFMPQSAAAIQDIHTGGFAHQNITPSKFLVLSEEGAGTEQLTYALSGFDIAGYPYVEKEYITGAPAYMAPEKILEGKIDQKGDDYSWAATLFRLLAGKPPYSELESPEDFIAVHEHGLPPFYKLHLEQAEFPDPKMRSVRRELVEEVVETVLAPTPEERPEIGEFAQGLMDHYTQLTPRSAKRRTVFDLKSVQPKKEQAMPEEYESAFGSAKKQKRGSIHALLSGVAVGSVIGLGGIAIFSANTGTNEVSPQPKVTAELLIEDRSYSAEPVPSITQNIVSVSPWDTISKASEGLQANFSASK